MPKAFAMFGRYREVTGGMIMMVRVALIGHGGDSTTHACPSNRLTGASVS